MTEVVEQAPPQAAGYRADELVQKYMMLRQRKEQIEEAHKASLAEIKRAMELIETVLHQMMQAQGVTSLRTPYGTPYFSKQTSATVADWDMYLDWVRATEGWEFLEHRCSKTAVEQYKTANEGELPPGVNWSERVVVNIKGS